MVRLFLGYNPKRENESCGKRACMSTYGLDARMPNSRSSRQRKARWPPTEDIRGCVRKMIEAVPSRIITNVETLVELRCPQKVGVDGNALRKSYRREAVREMPRTFMKV